MKTKTCTKCKKELPLDKFSRSRRHKGGYYPTCNFCCSEYKRAWYRKKHPKKQVTDTDMKECHACLRILPLEAFAKHKRSKDGKQYYCRECLSKKNTENYWRKKAMRKAEREAQRKYVTARKQQRPCVMDDWTEWHQLPPEVIEKMGEKEHRKYCEWWCKAHPLDLETVAKSLLAAMQNVMDDFEHDNAECMK